ncbi:aminotransferase class V-fold PLP-dependent enzyme [Pseudoalteromonas sp. MMG013]|uniref:aminotransferase class V-fold PLP-dependent enzyme n=1 Tax=Pseudoalteromonas sp. MMG013 TaxID=2822687 RepID=UPI001B37CFE5|nr:aminotransferase class V-fold PLP-dependent enzyme [Pseudoalteromonas sp. MMG013]MBQ4863880.1 aminotransferase class V-fold PLP-dependent enzyme [Pseudoalteromonas sp. MMG013]
MRNPEVLKQIYLDANATTPVLPSAAAAAMKTMETMFGNPSSSHVCGLQAKEIMVQSRRKAVEVLGAGAGQVIFTSGATEGIQTGILSALYAAKSQIKVGEQYSILYGATEHKAVPESLKHWNRILEIDAKIVAIPVDERGTLDMAFIAREVPNALMICTMAVNNETGVYQDLLLLEKTIRTSNPNVYWMVDCVQALGKTKMDLANISIDYAPFSGHKLYGPKGIGFVYIREGAPFTPFIAGGGQESGLRSGTENLPGLAALSVIFDEILGLGEKQFSPTSVLKQFRAQLALSLKHAFPTVVFNHSFDNSVPTTLNFSIPGFTSKEIMDLFDAANIRVSSGSACSSKVTRSFVLDAMGLAQWQSESAIRMSFGPAMTQHQIDAACERIQHCAQALGHSCLLRADGAIDEREELEGLLQLKVGGSCTWLYADKRTHSAVVIDPLPELSNRLLTILQCQKLSLIAAIDTHGHADHISGRVALAQTHLADQECDELGWPLNSASNTFEGQSFNYIEFGEHCLVHVATPGHTSDSISLLLCDKSEFFKGNLVPRFTFCGDLVLMGSVGRTNFESSNASAMYDSLRSLAKLTAKQGLLCPSHDYHNEFVTTFDVELNRNALLQSVIDAQISADEFISAKTALDKHIDDEQGSEIMCGAFIEPCSRVKVSEYDSDSLAVRMQSHHNIKLIDIREPHEYALSHDQSFNNNVPLTRLANFIAQQSYKKGEEIILVCRSGSRSQVAANALTRLGFEHVGHLKGGYALSH